MKINIFFLLSFFICLISQAQNSINYKAVINDDQGNPLSNQLVVIQFSILQGDDQTIVYSENHTPTTDVNGLIVINIGEGTPLSGDYTTIDWASDTHFLNIQVNSGGGLVDLGTTQFLTVPYAISAQTAENVNGLEPIDEGSGIGWRLVGVNPDFYGNIGSGAVDLSQSDSNAAEFGAVGSNAAAFGFRTRAESFAIAGGFETTASGLASVAFGNEALAEGLSAVAIGSNTTAQGEGATALGVQTFAGGEQSMAMGSVSTASGDHAITLGTNINARSYAEIALGTYNTAYTPASTTSFNANDRLLVIGNGTAANNASDAFILYKDGALEVGNDTEASGVVAVAFGNQTTASGDQSFVVGSQSVASGNQSFAVGSQSVASGDGGIAMGFSADALGFSSVAIGTFSLASGNNSLALGNGAEATGIGATAIGIGSEATGDLSSAFGRNADAFSFAETAVGSYNTIYTPASTSTFVDTDRLFVIGNGSGLSNRSNAMTILKNGNVGIGTSTPQERLHIANGRLRIGSETVEDTGSNRLEWNTSLFPDTDDTFQLGGSALRWTAVWATDGTINTSDRREKRDIQSLTYGLREILQLEPVSFRWKAKPEQGEKLGLIAQDVLEIIPEVVKTHEYVTTRKDEHTTLEKKELDRLGVYYTDLIPVLVKAIQEQQKVIDQHNKKIALLSKQTAEFSELEKRITTLETVNQ